MADKNFLLQKSKELRNNMTKQERKLWYEFLKDLPLTIKRQKIIGDYIADFYCFEKKNNYRNRRWSALHARRKRKR